MYYALSSLKEAWAKYVINDRYTCFVILGVLHSQTVLSNDQN